MTTLMSADGPAEVINARRTESLDAPNIHKLVQSSTESLFGRVNVVNLIEKAVLAVTLSNENDEVLGHAAFFDYPNIPGVDSAQWESWMAQHYKMGQCTPLNTLFMHYFVAKTEYSHGCAREIIRTMFNAVPDLHFCFLAVPTGVFPDSALSDIFKPTDKISVVKNPDNCSMFICHRHDHVPVLHVRPAKVEDHDDLVPIFNRQSDMLKQTYGSYFLAELIEAQGPDMQCVVAEVEGSAVGFMSLSTDVNVELLNECFELGAFHGLRKPHEEDELDAPVTPVPTPPPVVEAERPESGRSIKSTSSKGSHRSGSGVIASAEGPDGTEDQGTSRMSSSKEPGSRPSSKGSKTEEVRVRRRLSDASTHSSHSSNNSDAESIKSAVSEREIVQTSSSSQVIKSSLTPLPATPAIEVPAKQFIPKYKGEAAAFCIQLFCIDENYEMRSMDFLTKAFEMFPDYDFCIITVPHLVPEFPLLQQFMRVTPRNPSTLSQELYVFSRPGLLRSFRVRPASPSDHNGVEKLLSGLDLQDVIINDFKQYSKAKRDNDGTPIQTFVAECASQVVGIAVIRAEENIEYIRSHYSIEDFIYFNHHRREDHGHLHHYAINPVFKHYSKHFLKEVLRLGHKTCLYYPLFPAYADKELLSSHTLVAALNDMVPVRARRQISYPFETLQGNAPSDSVLKKEEPYALNHLNRKLMLEPKVTINARIVVVGASDTGIAFLESFAYCPHLRFNNLTLISPHGLPGELPPDDIRDGMLGQSFCYTQEEYAQMSLRTWVNVVYGRMTSINRKKNHVVVNGSKFVPYDHLILCTGTQYMMPAPTEADISQLVTSNEVPKSPDRQYRGVTPKNAFIVNDTYEASVALHWMEKHLLSAEDSIGCFSKGVLGCGRFSLDRSFSERLGDTPSRLREINSLSEWTKFCTDLWPSESLKNISEIASCTGMLTLGGAEDAVVVYGNSLDTYCCIQALLKLGVAGNRINLVEPPLNLQISCFNNSTVDSTVNDALKEAGVEVHSGYLLAQWNDGKDCEVITSASFTSTTKPLRLECGVFIAFYKKAVDPNAFRAVNDACLVYDGRLVIDANFHTNDVSIRAAGPLTKYQRSYHADQWTHANFNSKEIGIQLATAMLSLFDPTLEPEPEPPQDMLKLIPMYRSPKIQTAVLPGGYQYLHVGKPSLNTQLDALISQTDYGRELVTGTPGGEIEYFRLHVNQYSTVETITCISRKPIPAQNLICLFGLHEKFLNNLLSRFDEGLIKDFYSYFSETWCLAVFHDRFSDFRDEVRELLITRPSPDVAALEEKIRLMIEEDLTLNNGQRKILSDEFLESGAKRAVETRLLSFMSYNYYHLPMYAKPGMI